MVLIIKIKRILFILLPLLFIMSCSPPEREGIEVMTFNIRYDNPDDGMFSWENRKDMVFWIIEKYNPDIMGIQEALKGQMEDLEGALKDYSWSGVGRDNGIDKGEFVPIFFKKDRFMLADEGQFWLSETPEIPGSMGWDAACTRLVSWIKLKDIDTGLEYYFFNTHFDHMGEEARLKSAHLLVASIRSIAGLKPVILTGDFNCEAETNPIRVLTQLLIDSKEGALNSVISVPTTFLGFPANPDRNKIIDHIFMSRHFIVSEYDIVSDNSGGYFPSDHLPVRAYLELIMP